MEANAEDRLLGWLRRRLERQGNHLLGDDGAVLPAAGARVVTVDHQIAGVHYPPDLDPALVARRLLAVNLSDLAAMGARPEHALLALAVAPGFDAHRFFDALLTHCSRHGVRLAGGDLARSATSAASLTLTGKRHPGGRWLRRSTAEPGDRLWVSGSLGESAVGRRLVERGARLTGGRVALPEQPMLAQRLAVAARRAVRRHLLPIPHLAVGRWLARQPRAAAIDVSDGLALDLHRLCRASRVGARLDAGALPTAEGHQRLARVVEQDALELCLGGGEDYVLLFAIPAARRPPQRLGCRPVGRLTSGRRVGLVEAGGVRPLPGSGWDHLSKE